MNAREIRTWVAGQVSRAMAMRVRADAPKDAGQVAVPSTSPAAASSVARYAPMDARYGLLKARVNLMATQTHLLGEIAAQLADFNEMARLQIAVPTAVVQPFVDDVDRCAVCGGPTRRSDPLGCERGNCLRRPMPFPTYASERADRERLEFVRETVAQIPQGGAL